VERDACTGSSPGPVCAAAARVPGDARAAALVTGAELAACTFINILNAGKTGWVLIVVLLESFCKDLYHSVSA